MFSCTIYGLQIDAIRVLNSVYIPVGKGQRVGVTRGDLSDSVGILINIRRLTLQSHFCFNKTFIGGQDATIVINMILQ